MRHKFWAVCCAAVMTAGLFAGCGTTKEDVKTEKSVDPADELSDGAAAEEKAEEPSAKEGESDGAVLDVSKPLSGIHHAELVIKDYGTIKMELDADTAPITVTNFVKLAQDDFYDGLTFHRIIEGFMMQGGDPNGDGTGGAEEDIKGEFASNGVENDILHKKGTVSMARASDPDSASSQFFIMHEDAPHLDGDYAAFGHVTEGIEIVDEICENAKPINSQGLVDTPERPVIEDIRIVD